MMCLLIKHGYVYSVSDYDSDLLLVSLQEPNYRNSASVGLKYSQCDWNYILDKLVYPVQRDVENNATKTIHNVHNI